MEIAELKQYLKSRGMTYKDLAEKSNVSESTLKNLFSGVTKNPRIDTMRAIETALGLYEPTEIPKKLKAVLEAIADFSDDEMKELKNYIAFIVSKRK